MGRFRSVLEEKVWIAALKTLDMDVLQGERI